MGGMGQERIDGNDRFRMLRPPEDDGYDHGTEEVCVRGGLDVVAGVCIPVWTGRM